MTTLYRLLRNLIVKLEKAYILRKYNDFNIEEYFRKQGAKIGENNRIMIRSLGDDPYLIRIGNHCSISSGVQFVCHDGGGWIFTEEIPSLQKFGKVEIKDNCYIGTNCIILPNVAIGPNSIIGAGSVVSKDVPPNVVVAGSPAKFIKTIEQYKNEILMEWKKQKPPNYFVEEGSYSRYSPEQIQKMKDKDRILLVEHLKRILNE